MLDLQRQRYAPLQSSAAILFARKIIFVHLGFGLLIVALLLFHELFIAAGWVTTWLVLTLLVTIGMTKSIPGSRVLLAVLFIGGSATGFFQMVWKVPALKPAVEPLLPLYYLPYWLVIAILGYASAAYGLLFSNRIRRACEKGFTLMDTPKPF